MIRLLSLLFFFSGAAGLLYETIWARYLGLFVGHEAYAQVLVLVIFLGGMAIGAWLISLVSARIKRPLLAYALVEIAIGLAGLVFHDAFVSATAWAYDVLLPAFAGSSFLGVVKWSLAGALILPQSILLGATFPLMSAGVLRLDAALPGRVLANLYFANSLGAAAGALLSSFVLVAAAGLPGTILAAAITNLLVAAATIVATHTRGQSAPPAALPASDASARDRALVRLLLAVSAGTAISSFIYEIDWIRMLALVLGSATHSFDLMVSAFILGLASGAWWTRRRADRFADPLRALATVQWIMGGLALATLPLYSASFSWIGWLLHNLAKTDGGYAGFTVARYAICLVVMLPATFCAGVTLPLITSTLLTRGEGERAVGTVYAANTLGSIFGTMVAGLVLLPWLGLKGMLTVGAAIDMLLGVWLLLASSQRRGAGRNEVVGAVAATAVAVVIMVATPPLDQRLLISGVYRFGDIPDVGQYETLFLRHGRTATVSVGRTPSTDERFIATNGKADASLPAIWRNTCTDTTERKELTGDPATQASVAILPLAHRPDARTAAIIGMGSGMTSSILLGDPRLERVTTIEIEPAMAEGARQFLPANARVFTDPRSTIAIADAKSYFASQAKTYDLILSEPSNPWVSGVSTLFTTEFYQRIRRHLAPHGVFGQWFHLYELDDPLVLTVLAAVHRSFPAYDAYIINESDLVIVAATEPTMPRPDWSVVRLPGIAATMCHFLPLTPEVLDAMRVIGHDGLAPLFDAPDYAGKVNSDFYPSLDLGAERTRYLGSNANGLYNLNGAQFDVAAAFTGRRVAPFRDTIATIPGVPRIHGLAIAARLRLQSSRDQSGTQGEVSDAAKYSRFRLQQWNALLNGDRPPTDWHLWLNGMAEVEADVNGTAQGVADEGFFRSAEAYAARAKAPPLVRAAIAFRHALANWDFPAVLKAGEVIAPGGVPDGDPIIPGDELRDGMVMAALRTGAADKADLYFRALQPAVHRPDDDFRTVLLSAYLAAALRQGHRETR